MPASSVRRQQVALSINAAGSFGIGLRVRNGDATSAIIVTEVETNSANRDIVMPGDEVIEVAGIACRGDKELCVKTLVENKSKAPIQCAVLRAVRTVERGLDESVEVEA